MTKLHEKLSINTFSIENVDISGIEEIISSLPRNGVVDSNIAERGLLYTLEGQNLCQEKIVQIDRWIGSLESTKNKAWSSAALKKAKEAGFKTVKDKEWYAQADDDYIDSCNQLVLAKACKKWLENKANYFSAWHYALKTFLRRDYSIENASGIGYNRVSVSAEPFPALSEDNDIGADDIEWG
jgi:hypothetical protein